MATKYNPPVVEFLTKEERATWADKSVVFFVTDCELGAGQFGPNQATYKLTRLDKSGQVQDEHYISFTIDSDKGNHNKRRADESAWFLDVLSDGPVGPMKLTRVPTSQGNDAWAFASAE